jgi:hypothetical protein
MTSGRCRERVSSLFLRRRAAGLVRDATTTRDAIDDDADRGSDDYREKNK